MCKSYWNIDLWFSEGEKTHFEKTAFKNMYCNWNLLTQIDKVLEKKHLSVFFPLVWKTLYEKPKSQNWRAWKQTNSVLLEALYK